MIPRNHVRRVDLFDHEPVPFGHRSVNPKTECALVTLDPPLDGGRNNAEPEQFVEFVGGNFVLVGVTELKFYLAVGEFPFRVVVVNRFEDREVSLFAVGELDLPRPRHRLALQLSNRNDLCVLEKGLGFLTIQRQAPGGSRFCSRSLYSEGQEDRTNQCQHFSPPLESVDYRFPKVGCLEE